MEKCLELKLSFFAQLFISITLIIASIAILALHDANRDFWMVILSSVMGYIVPSTAPPIENLPPFEPAVKKEEKKNFPEIDDKAAQKMERAMQK